VKNDRRVYRTLLVLYPKAFRDEFTPDLTQTFDELVRDHGAANAWRRSIVDLAVTVPRYRLESTMHTRKSNTALNTLVVVLAVAWVGTLATGTYFGLPLLALAVLLGVTQRSQLARSLRGGIVSDTAIAHKRKTCTIVVVASIAIFAIGLLINALPSQDVHDSYWTLFVAPSMIAFIVGVAALALLLWSYLPRRREPDEGFSANL
jgi:peptidoglycan/LPS O-acetylase OafA/YrhL